LHSVLGHAEPPCDLQFYKLECQCIYSESIDNSVAVRLQIVNIVDEKFRAPSRRDNPLTQEWEYRSYRFAHSNRLSAVRKWLTSRWRSEPNRSSNFFYYFTLVFVQKLIHKLVMVLQKIASANVSIAVPKWKIPEIA